MTPVLACRSVTKRFSDIVAVDRISLDLHAGQIIAIVGGSGSGKSTLANLLLGLEDPTAGDVTFEGERLQAMDRKGRLAFRAAVQMVFQDPYASLNPRMTVRQTVAEPLTIHSRGSMGERAARTIAALADAGLQPVNSFLDCYPHQLSGGQRQRVAIARAMVLGPRVLVADEPVSMLDVSIRAGILRLLERASRVQGAALAFITHDLSLVGPLADEIAVIHKGRLVEFGPTKEVLAFPRAEYTRSLLDAVPRIRRH
jgi:peptide/nickel transport system ATP-binding protein